MPRRLCISRVAGAVAIVVGALLAPVPFATEASAQTGWSTPAPVDKTTPDAFEQLSCPTTTFCVAVDNAGSAVIFDGHSWSSPAVIDPSALSSVSCASATFCMAVDSAGEAIVGTAGAAGEQVAFVFPGQGGQWEAAYDSPAAAAFIRSSRLAGRARLPTWVV